MECLGPNNFLKKHESNNVGVNSIGYNVSQGVGNNELGGDSIEGPLFHCPLLF